jgi:hypothetical protein
MKVTVLTSAYLKMHEKNQNHTILDNTCILCGSKVENNLETRGSDHTNLDVLYDIFSHWLDYTGNVLE